MRCFFKENGLTIAFSLLFVTFAVGQAWTGLHSYNAELAAHGRGALRLTQYLCTGTYLDSVFTNWQAAILQLYVLIMLSSFLFQKGATHSRRIEQQRRAHGTGGWLHHNSLSVSFLLLFLLCFAGHLATAAMAENERLELQGRVRVPFLEFAASPVFWTLTFANWQAEMFALVVYLPLSIVLRQRDSPESKPEDAPDSQTGGANE